MITGKTSRIQVNKSWQPITDQTKTAATTRRRAACWFRSVMNVLVNLSRLRPPGTVRVWPLPFAGPTPFAALLPRSCPSSDKLERHNERVVHRRLTGPSGTDRRIRPLFALKAGQWAGTNRESPDFGCIALIPDSFPAMNSLVEDAS